MKTHIPTRQHPASHPSKGAGQEARTNYPSQAPLQGKFFFSIGASKGLAHKGAYQEQNKLPIEDARKMFERTKAKGDKEVLPNAYDVDTGAHFNPEPACCGLSTKDGALQRIKPNEELEIAAHGGTQRDAVLGIDIAAQYGGHTPQELGDLLIQNGLPKTYQGTIYLSGCTAGAGAQRSYAHQLLQYLHQNHIQCTVKAYIGATALENDVLKVEDNRKVVNDLKTKVDSLKTNADAWYRQVNAAMPTGELDDIVSGNYSAPSDAQNLAWSAALNLNNVLIALKSKLHNDAMIPAEQGLAQFPAQADEKEAVQQEPPYIANANSVYLKALGIFEMIREDAPDEKMVKGLFQTLVQTCALQNYELNAEIEWLS